ncbi:MAG: 4Fe-4S dicluster domain-containing protein [Deltaproteobacteria bacterium]|nr:4Fe-4S dicluster domain-containing protein [Deltaproteobacteria bacterium]
MKTEKTYWKSFEEIAALSSTPRNDNGGDTSFDISRRKFLSLLGASMALATTSCRRPIHKIIPFVKESEAAKPGIAEYYASSYPISDHSLGVLVKTREGRPIKIEGNPEHPLSLGGTNSFVQASVLELYDPDRLRTPKIKNKKVSVEEWDYLTSSILRHAHKEKKVVRILTESTGSPTLRNTLNSFVSQFSNAKWYEYEPFSHENSRAAYKASFGKAHKPKIHLEKANVILSLNSDFLGADLSAPTYIKNWTSKRKVHDVSATMSRLYAVESRFSLTGANADHRLALKPSELLIFALNLAQLLTHDFDGKKIPSFKHRSSFSEEFIKTVAEDLASNKKKSLVVVGDQESEELHIVGNFLNFILGNYGETISRKIQSPSFFNGIKSMTPLIEELEKEKVDVLITLGGNPVYHLGEKFREALSKVKESIRVSLYEDETAHSSTYIAPLSHYLESWSDQEPETGLYSVGQPTIQPLYPSKSMGEVLVLWGAALEKKEIDALQVWRNAIKSYAQKSTNTTWKKLLHDGVVKTDKISPQNYEFNMAALESTLMLVASRAERNDSGDDIFELQLEPSSKVWDGRFANSAWLQELPHPVTKVTWDNVASMSPETAKNLNVTQENKIEITANGASLVLPVFIQPGLAQNVITTEIGYGRTHAGSVGSHVGVNVFPLIQATNIKVQKVSGSHEVATTQKHHDLMGRPIIFESTLEEYKQEPDFPKKQHHVPEMHSMYKNDHEYKGHKWGMTIDLNSCVGCNGCVTACDSENNIPVVGKEQVLKGREMQWMRIDRYYDTTNEHSPTVLHQPMLCQHCENAPCENVCPVVATTHSDEGLNQMIYNRCVGTRYCANNCPYKVRRFNFFNFNYDMQSPEELGKNPDVTVRFRGVMEKCSFCVQRIHDGKHAAKMEGVSLQDGKIKTACQQACPAEAIVFGDLNDPNSSVSKLSNLSHGYHVLGDLNVKPSITYLAKVRNYHPNLFKFYE